MTRTIMTGRRGDMQGPLWRAIAVFRVAALGYVTFLVVRNFDAYAHPVAGWLALAVMAGWTALAWWAFAQPRRRGWPLLIADLAVTAAVEFSSSWIIGRDTMAHGVPSLTVAWIGGPVLTWAVSGGRRRGLIAALVLGAVNVTVRGGLRQSTLTGVALLLLAGVAVGHVTRLLLQAQERLQRAAELAAATRERERLARGIHDSVLQVLAMVQRRGAQLDSGSGEAAELVRLAGEQEAALRALITTGWAADEAAEGAAAAVVDLRSVLSGYAGSTVTVAAPAEPVALPARVAREVGRAVGAALDNVTVHCGERARAWVLVEDEPEAVTVTVRDEGPGFAAGRLAEAEAQGRLGVAQSIRGRLTDLGGAVAIVSAPGQGTEVELRLPRSWTA